MPSEDGPLTARSVLASALLGESPPELPVGQLIRLASLFGINENRARVALSRMVSNGELTTTSGHYRLLSPSLLQRQTRQQHSLHGETADWDGTWKLVVITARTSTAADRGTRRKLFIEARFAERRDGVWMRPDNLDNHGLGDGAFETFRARPQGDPTQLAAELWDLATWNVRALTLIKRMGDMSALTPADLASGFVLSASILRHVQADPLLPVSLLPGNWPGHVLRERYADWNIRYRRLLRPSR